MDVWLQLCPRGEYANWYCSSSVSQIQQSSACLNTLLKQEEVDEQDLLDNIKTISTVSSLALSNLNRAARLVQSFKRTSVDQLSEKARRYNIKEVLDDCSFYT